MGSHGNQDIDVGDMRISKDSLFLMKEMADPTKVDFGQKERTDIENAPSIIRDQLKKSAREARHAKEKKERHERHERHKRRERDDRRSSQRSTRQEAEDRARSSRRDERPSRREERPPLVPPSRLAGPSSDVIRAKSRSGHEDSMMAKAMEMARSRSRGVSNGGGVGDGRGVQPSSSSDPLAPSSLDVTRRPDNNDKDIPLPAVLTSGSGMPNASSKASEFRMTAGGPVPSSSIPSRPSALRSSVLDRKMSEARDRSRYNRDTRDTRDDRSMSRYRSREDDYKERFRNLNRDASRMRSRYDDRNRDGDRSSGGGGWRDDYQRSHRHDRRDDRSRHHGYRPSRPSFRSRDSRAEEIEKKDYLMAMEKMKMQGIQLTKNYTMEDSLVDIQYEFERHNLNLESIQKVETSKSYIRILAVVIVVINHFTGRHLKLVGWTEKLSTDLDNPKYFMALEEMCRSMHRRGPPSPWIQLAIMFVSSIFVTHANNQWGLGLGNSSNGNGGPSGGGGAKDSGGGLGGLLGSLGGINLGSVLGTVGSMFGAGGGGAGPRPVPVVPHGPTPTGPPPASSSSSNPSNASSSSNGSRSFRKPLVRP